MAKQRVGSFSFGFNVRPKKAKAKKTKAKRKSTGPRTWKGMSFGS